jgi:hypothetical protein
MAQRHVVGMLMMHHGTPRDQRAWEELAAALPGAELSPPDELGVFEVTLEAEDREAALVRIWDAVGLSGTDDHLLFLEHPDNAEHWRERSGTPERSASA